MDSFGEIFVPSQLEEAAISTLSKWFPTYLRRLERKLGLVAESVKNPVKYNNRNSFTAVKGEELPRVVVISPGLIGQPVLEGRNYKAYWRLGVGIASAAQDEVLANMNSKIYGAAARAIMVEKRGMGIADGTAPHIRGVSWIDENYDDLPIDHQTLLYKAAGVYFAVEVESVVSTVPGPTEPDQPAYPDYGQVPDIEHVIVQADKES